MIDQAALSDALRPHIEDGSVPGLVAAVGTADTEEVVVLGRQSIDGPAMSRHSIFRIASISKPITAAATMVLAERGVLALDEPVDRFLPELAQSRLRVLRTMDGPVDDTVPAKRPITTRHLLTFTAGHGFPSDFSYPVVQLLFERINQGPPNYQSMPDPDTWMQRLTDVPLVHQPGEGWTYNTGSDILGVLLSRASGQPLAELMHDVIFEPLGMGDTGFHVPPSQLGRMTTFYRREPVEGQGDGGQANGEEADDGHTGVRLSLADEPDGQWASPAPFTSGAGGLVSTVDDWMAFGRMLLGQGEYRGRRVLSEDSVAAMTTDAIDELSRHIGRTFLDGQGWGFGGSVDVAVTEPWTELRRYGWIGGTGTAAYVSFARGLVTLLMTQVELGGPVAPAVMADFLTATAG